MPKVIRLLGSHCFKADFTLFVIHARLIQLGDLLSEDLTCLLLQICAHLKGFYRSSLKLKALYDTCDRENPQFKSFFAFCSFQEKIFAAIERLIAQD